MKKYISWNTVENFISDVVKQYKDANLPGVFGIPRGGLVFAVMLSHRLNIPMLMSPVPGCMIVDDICDSGESLLHYVKNSSGVSENGYHIVTMFYKNNQLNIIPEYWYMEKDEAWIIFCWEMSLTDVLDQYSDEEIWIDLPQYESRYEVSTFGQVYGKVSNKILTYRSDINLYAYKGDVGTRFNRQDIIAGAFLGLDFTNPYHNRVMFKDGDSKNVHVGNLYIENLEDLPDEEWKLITTWKGFSMPSWYYISSFGRIKSIARDVVEYKDGVKIVAKYCGRMLKPFSDGDGYLAVEIPDINGAYHMLYIHRAVAEYFLPAPNPGDEVNHIDGIKSNNTVSNLEWCTHQDNMTHASKLGLLKQHNK